MIKVNSGKLITLANPSVRPQDNLSAKSVEERMFKFQLDTEDKYRKQAEEQVQCIILPVV